MVILVQCFRNQDNEFNLRACDLGWTPQINLQTCDEGWIPQEKKIILLLFKGDEFQ